MNKSVSLDKDSDIFEKGKTDIFEVESVDVGKVYLTVKFVFESHKNLIVIINFTYYEKIKSVKIGHDGDKMASAWQLESLTIESANGNETLFISSL